MSAATVVITTAVAAPAYADQPCGNGFSVGGRIEQEYVYLGGSGALGNCTTKELNSARNGKFQEFQNDGNGGKTTIYWNNAVANGYAKMVRGEIYKRWTFYGWEQGALGYPTISEAQLATRGGKYNTFEGGSIYWSPNSGAHAVFGAIRDSWAAAGYETGTYGYPITDEYELDGGIEQQFEGGTLKYNPGEQADGDPQDTNPEFGKDDPRFQATSRFSFNTPKPAAECFSTDTPGEKVCGRIGSSDQTNDSDPPVDARLRRAPNSSTTPLDPSPSPTSPAPTSSAPASSAPASSAPVSEAPTSTTSVAPTSPASPAPADQNQAPESTPTDAETTTTTTPLAGYRGELGTEHGQIHSALGSGSAPHFVRAAAPKPGLGGVEEPGDPARDTAAEKLFFDADTDCKGGPLGTETFYAGRFYACAVLPYTFQVTQTDSQGIETNKGWTKGWAYFKQLANAKSLSTRLVVRFLEKAPRGDISGARIRMDFSATGGSVVADPNGQGSTPQFGNFSDSPTFVVNINHATFSSTNKVENMTPTIQVNFYKGGYRDSYRKIQPFNAQALRCDSMVYIPGQGCVMAPGAGTAEKSGKPIMDLGDQFFPGKSINIYRDHILRAVNSLLPGNARAPIGRSLTRIEYRSKQAAENRVQACAPARTRQYKPSPTSSWQCDEFPFASTAEGAALDKNGGRTFNFCKFTSAYLPIYSDFQTRTTGYSSCIIPADQNRTGGSIIPTFNRKNRLLFANDTVPGQPTDGFFVLPYP